MRSWDPRAPHSFSESSCRSRTRPPFGHDRVCSIKNFLPQPSQVGGVSCGISPYMRRRLSRNSSQDNSVSLRRWVTFLSHAPFLVALWRRFLSCPPASSFRLSSYPRSTCIFVHLAARLALRTHIIWPTDLRAEVPKRESTSSPLAALEVLYSISADSWIPGIPNMP